MSIPNHLTATLSELDMRIIRSVPPGGNWKNLPDDIPSNRIKTIREDYRLGKGSRSTYYGRLLPNEPSYTINTYFNRPGNGCHIHYKEDRVLSQREAARLQSFPDDFVFYGSQASINNQIGNAVPPLLAFQIAKQIESFINSTGFFIDLFSGAGGLGLGFKWAGWQACVANDIDLVFLTTYSKNVHSDFIHGSITDPLVFDEIVKYVTDFKNQHKDLPLWVLGGPPCQGFSTGGGYRSMDDERNLLFRNYVEFLNIIKPDGFLFENVSGILNMENGKVFEHIKSEFASSMPNVKKFILNSDNYAIPQRRKRVFLLGQKLEGIEIVPPKMLTSINTKEDLWNKYTKSITVSEALSDLPELIPGQDGSNLSYRHDPSTNYQQFMRGQLSPSQYLKEYGW